jgi:hypothetical protein
MTLPQILYFLTVTAFFTDGQQQFHRYSGRMRNHAMGNIEQKEEGRARVITPMRPAKVAHERILSFCDVAFR